MSNEKTEQKKKYGFLRIFFKLAPTVIVCAPVIYIINMLISVVHGTSWGVITLMQQRFFDKATMLTTGKIQFADVLIALLLLGVTQIISQVLNGLDNYLICHITVPKITGKLSLGIQRKIARIAAVDFEDTDKLDDINKAEQGKNNATWFVVTFITTFTFYLPYFIFMSWYLFSLKPILVISIVIVFIPTVIAQVIRTKVFVKLEDQSAPCRREYDYYESCMTSREYFKETRLLGGFKYFKDLYLDAMGMLQKLKYKATMKTNLFELSMRMITVVGYFVILYMLFSALMGKEITVGAFAAVFNSIGMLFGIMEELIYQHIGGMAKDLGTIRNYVNFLEMDERKGTVLTSPGWGDITLENVDFAYPKADKNAVKKANFTLKKGETLAIVGENGSGKSTLIRLITGLYVPKDGRVLINGVDTKNLAGQALYGSTSAVFQKYQRYQMTLEENLTISRSNAEYNEKRLDEIGEMAGVDKEDSAFTDGYQTMLSREFDGVDLSGGQWQRVAIARGFFRSHNLIVLDEPTAAIDPYEETRIYNRFAEIAKGKSAVIVTHRLGSVKLADRIVVMKDGEVSQIGTHNELIASDGEYKRLYESQQQWYEEEKVTV